MGGVYGKHGTTTNKKWREEHQTKGWKNHQSAQCKNWGQQVWGLATICNNFVGVAVGLFVYIFDAISEYFWYISFNYCKGGKTMSFLPPIFLGMVSLYHLLKWWWLGDGKRDIVLPPCRWWTPLNQWPLQEPIHWRYLPYIRHIF